MRSSFRRAATVATVTLAATAGLIGGQLQRADAAVSDPGRAGGCLREGSILDFRCPGAPNPTSREHPDPPVHASGREVTQPAPHRDFSEEHPVVQERATRAQPRSEQVSNTKPSTQSVTPAQQSTPNNAPQHSTQPTAQTVPAVHHSAQAPTTNPVAAQTTHPTARTASPEHPGKSPRAHITGHRGESHRAHSRLPHSGY